VQPAVLDGSDALPQTQASDIVYRQMLNDAVAHTISKEKPAREDNGNEL